MPAGPEREDHVVAGQRFHVGGLDGRARDDGLLAGADHHLGRRGHLVLDDPVEVRLGGHADDRFDRRGVDVMALVEAVVEADQDVAGAGRGVGLALDHDAVAARGDVHAEPAFDHHQMAVVVAEQRPEQIGLVELELEAGAVLVVGVDGGEVAAGHQAATCVGARGAGHAVGAGGNQGDVDHVAERGVGFEMHRLQPRRVADHLAGAPALCGRSGRGCPCRPRRG